MVYLSNCINGIQSSEMDCYSEFSNPHGSVALNQDNVALINPLSFTNWLGLPGRAPADFSSDTLFFLDSISKVQVGRQDGASHDDGNVSHLCRVRLAWF